MTLTPRIRNIIRGLIAIVQVMAAVTIGVKFAFGAFSGGYTLTGRFAAAGQGLLHGSDVKIRGVNVGSVESIKLVDGEALVTMRIHRGEEVPTTTEAVIRPKTLFGEKFVDLVPGDGEATGPFYEPGDEIEHTLGGFELERVLSDAYPILKAIDPSELATVLNTLADGAVGEGPAINRQIVNSQKILDVQVAHDADTRQFLADLALLSEELAGRAPDVVDLAKDLNVALPPLNARSAELTTLLEQASRLSGDLADVLEANRPFLTKNVVQGGKTLQVLYDQRDQIVPLVMGLRQYEQTLAEAVHIPAGDGTFLAGVKGLLAGDACVVFGCAPSATAAPATPAATTPEPGSEALLGQASGAAPVDLRALVDRFGPSDPPAPSSGALAITELVMGLRR